MMRLHIGVMSYRYNYNLVVEIGRKRASIECDVSLVCATRPLDLAIAPFPSIRLGTATLCLVLSYWWRLPSALSTLLCQPPPPPSILYPLIPRSSSFNFSHRPVCLPITSSVTIGAQNSDAS